MLYYLCGIKRLQTFWAKSFVNKPIGGPFNEVHLKWEYGKLKERWNECDVAHGLIFNSIRCLMYEHGGTRHNCQESIYLGEVIQCWDVINIANIEQIPLHQLTWEWIDCFFSWHHDHTPINGFWAVKMHRLWHDQNIFSRADKYQFNQIYSKSSRVKYGSTARGIPHFDSIRRSSWLLWFLSLCSDAYTNNIRSIRLYIRNKIDPFMENCLLWLTDVCNCNFVLHTATKPKKPHHHWSLTWSNAR